MYVLIVEKRDFINSKKSKLIELIPLFSKKENTSIIIGNKNMNNTKIFVRLFNLSS